ncbi:DUF742 domain-containing protein [Angustibacter aerolatus]
MIPVDPLDLPADLAEDEADDDTYAVRPYAVTGGRTRTSAKQEALPVEALVQSFGGDDAVGLTPERRKIIALTSTQFLSVAELSAHVELPVGIVRVLIADMAEAGQVKIHGLGTTSQAAPATSLSVLESVLNGISSL